MNTIKCNPLLLTSMLVLFSSRLYAVEVPLVSVGSPENTPDVLADFREVGGVDYSYQIGQFEITYSQYIEFLNSVAKTDTYGLFDNIRLYDTPSPGGLDRRGEEGQYEYFLRDNDEAWANRPVGGVNLLQAMRFANWMHNGQPQGNQDPSTTEDGSYTLNGMVITGLDEFDVSRNPDATWVIPTEDEWYKAAYYDPVTDYYFQFATGSDTISCLTDANCDRDDVVQHYYTTEVGSFVDYPSPWGTFDQQGNLWEWTETMVDTRLAILRGGWFWSLCDKNCDQRKPAGDNDLDDDAATFRLAFVPEPNFSVLPCLVFVCFVIQLRRSIRTK